MQLRKRTNVRLWHAALVALATTMTAGLGAVQLVAAHAASEAPYPAAGVAAGGVAPGAQGELDCNHYSPIQQSVRQDMWCADLFNPGATGDDRGRFYDNGHYIGHDEPDLGFLSSSKGSGNDVTWTETLGTDPVAAPTVKTPGSDVTHMFELSVAPWFSMALCDPGSWPQLPCTPQSDANTPKGNFPGAGSAFMEMQFYPPGFAPFADGISCDNTHWCAAMNIDSLACNASTPNFGPFNCNGNCIEPVNFSYIQTDGVPPGPPSPQRTDLATFRPNAHTLLMNPGDRVRTHLVDAPIPNGGGQRAFEATVTDLTTGQTGFIQASAVNGFMHTSMVDCSGVPFNFEPEYSTAAAPNIVGWTALRTNISTQFEIGHFEACTSLSDPKTFTINGGTDPYFDRCHGPYEQSAPGGDGSKGPETGDGFCFLKGDTHPGLGGAAPDTITGCLANADQNGDLDFDGSPYWPDWPTGTSAGPFPSTFQQQSPRTVGGATYPQFVFQTDAALSESTCSGQAPSGCAVPAPNAPGNFYPYWTRAGACTWEFGNVSSGATYGKDAQYGTNRLATLGYPEIISNPRPNPCT